MYKSKKADPPKKAYQGMQKKQEPFKDRYRNPKMLGTPVEPVTPGSNPKGETRQLESQKVVKRAPEGFKDEQQVVYQPRSVPKYSDIDQNIDAEDMKYNFKSGKGVNMPKEHMTELHGQHGRLPDEFHNTDYEQRNPGKVQRVHYDHYDPQVEGFFGAGYSYEPT